MGAVGDLSFTLGFPTVLDTKFYDSGGLSAFTNASTQLVKSSSRMDSQSLNAIVDIIIALEANIGLNAQDIYVDIAARLDAMTTAIGTSWDAEQTQDTIGSILLNTTTIGFTYTDGTPSIVANVQTNSIGPSELAQFTGNSLLGNPTGSTANASAITLATGLRFVASTLDLAINSLAADGTPDAANDFVVTWDASAATHKKVLLNLIGGGLSGGAADKLAIWTSATALTNDTELHYNTTNNNLGLGTTTFGTNLKYGIAISHDGTNYPSTSITDVMQMYVKDQTGSTTASLFVRGEDNGVTSIGTRLLVGNAGALLSNGVAAGGLQLDGVGPHLQMSNTALIAHGMSSLVATSVFFDVRPVVAGDGGVQIRGITETSLATVISSIVTSAPSTTKSTSADGALRFEFGLKDASSVQGLGAGAYNLAVFTDVFVGGTGTCWILGNNGATWQTGIATYQQSVEANTAGVGSPNVLVSSTENLKILTNEGSTAKNYHTLDTAVAGKQYTFVVLDTDGLRITAAAGDDIRIGASASTVAGYAESTTIGDSVTLVAVNVTNWIATSYVGTWTLA